ncbi:MAG: STAS domain-containing protein [Flavobacteriales bacterium]
MAIEIETKEKYIIATPKVDKLDSSISPSLKSELVMANADGAKNIILNLQHVKYCDSSGLSAVLIGNRICRNTDGTFVICCLQDAVMNLIKISQLDRIINLTPTLSEAEDLVILEEVGREAEEG